jgi:signal transduction histidine kinase/ActR/RegA family two-component response regulator
METAWFALAAATTLINSGTLGFIALRERNRTLGLWAGGWLTWAVAVLPLSLLERAHDAHLALLCGALWVASTLFFLGGSYAFVERPMPRAWFGVAAACGLVAFGLGITPNGGLGMVPLTLFQSLGLGATGLLLIKASRRKAGAWLCGAALIALALHLLAAPLMAEAATLMPWGFALATSLEFLTALGMLMLYYEQARAQLIMAQAALEERNRMEALGRVAGGVAHDFNNLLTVLQGQLELMRLDTAGAERLEPSMNAMEQAVQQATRLTSQLLAFGRRSVLQPRAIDVREVVQGTLALLKNVIPGNVQVTFRCAEGSYQASMDRTLLEQIVLNLVTNARDAITGPGRIVVELERVDAPTAGVTLRVADSGSGMDQAVLSKAFEPFFTTKGTDRGTGLGLASVQGAVSQLGGHIRVDSRLGEGTTFEVFLRANEPPPPPAARPEPAEVGTLDILVVDDVEHVREVTTRLLEMDGHHVTQASDGAEALELIRAGHYDLVLSDVVMPRVGGLALVKAVSRERPDTLVVLTSGYPRDAEVDSTPVQFLPKPFQQKTLLSRVRKLVGEHRSIVQNQASQRQAAR